MSKRKIRFQNNLSKLIEQYILEVLADGEWYDDNMEEVIEKYWGEAVDDFKQLLEEI